MHVFRYVPGHHYADAVIDEVARVPCRAIVTQAAQPDTAVYTKTAADGVTTVMRIVFRGEKAMHIVTVQPRS